MRLLLIVLGVLVLGGAAAGIAFWYAQHAANPHVLILYGNIDLRQIQLAFNNNERIVKVHVEEGDTVKEGQPLAELDRARLKPQVANMAAQADAQEQAYLKLSNGSRPEEKIQAQYNFNAARADLVNARKKYNRLVELLTVRLSDKKVVRGASQEEVDDAKAALDVAESKFIVQQEQYILTEIGPREEEIAEARARFEASKAQLAFLQRQLDDAVLKAPTDAVVRSRLMEPGEMSSPQRPVFSLAVIKKKWVRAYVSEIDLGKVKEGLPASVFVDSYPGRTFKGQIGFISPVAEFTPKTVQTEELRASLVYEVRIIVDDAANELRLGMPATVHVQIGE